MHWFLGGVFTTKIRILVTKTNKRSTENQEIHSGHFFTVQISSLANNAITIFLEFYIFNRVRYFCGFQRVFRIYRYMSLVF